MHENCLYFAVLLAICLKFSSGYSASKDAQIIQEYKQNVTRNHALIARTLVHQTDWASVGSISVNKDIQDYPMVNIISINDNNKNGQSTGRIQFLLTDLDFTGNDWQNNNKVTFLFSDEQQLHCTKKMPSKIDPMEPTCPRIMISGAVTRLDVNSKYYKESIYSFVKRHPAAENWLKAHDFYLCELDIKNIFVLDFYGGPHTVTSNDYYNAQL